MRVNKAVNDNLYEMVNAYYTSLFKESDCEMTTVGNYAERIYSGGTPMTSNAAYWNGTFGWFFVRRNAESFCDLDREDHYASRH